MSDLSWKPDPSVYEGKGFLENDNYIIITIHIKDFFDQLPDYLRFDLTKPDGGPLVDPNKLNASLERFEKELPVHLGITYYNTREEFGDIIQGRHRLFAAYKLGQEVAPIYTWEDTLEEFKNEITWLPNQ